MIATIELAGKVALVTGAAQGIGKAIAEALALQGAIVVINDIPSKEEIALRTIAEIAEKGGRTYLRVADVTQKEAVEDMYAWLQDRFTRLDILVNNVGVIRDQAFVKMSEEDWDLVVNTNLKSYFLCSQQAAKMMIEQQKGRIINISSRAWLGGHGQANYSASKGGVISLTRTLAIELAKHEITVNAIAPGLINTPMYQNFRDDVKERLLQMQPMKRLGQPEDIANGVLFFAGDRSGYITGQTLYICGGKSLYSNFQ